MSASFLFAFTAGAQTLETAAPSQPQPQKFVVEVDYGAPLLKGISAGYLINPRWETSIGLCLGQGFVLQNPNFVRIYLNYFRVSAQGRYNLTERSASAGSGFQPYLNFGYDVTYSTQESTYMAYAETPAMEQDLQMGLGLEYFFLPEIGVGLTLDYIQTLVFTNLSPPSVKQSSYYTPYLPWDSPSLSPNFPVDPNFYLQFRF
ncbi:MAG TPA: outer membrane beta-barrel protein [bacterium]|nr:outer membrane beta-barrel protein [bacterium]